MSQMPVKWDDANPWHSYFLVMIECRCASCGLIADTNDLFHGYKRKGRRDQPYTLFRFCIQAGERMETQGWKIEGNMPFCPDCLAKNQDPKCHCLRALPTPPPN